VAKKVSLIAVKVLTDQGAGAWSWIIAGLNYVLRQHQNHPIFRPPATRKTVVSMSLGGGYSQSVNDAVNKVASKGVLVSVAAGNENTDACDGSPASAELPLTVGASTIKDYRAFFSNVGKCVDIFAPGYNVLSAWNEDRKSFKILSGTSMAAPHVAGVAAALWTKMPGGAADSVKKLILDTATQDSLSSIGDSPNKLLYVGEA
jgi:subtilisin family serine protease